ncbi:Rha family transcriptional regulator [Psychrobacillus sp. FSL K6-1464]|uniref:Rha family transcriptional regulator n=1 Tax=Psychrobacillus sp. FSL K6-1464 TaxID=2921545 RepID=UPI0030F5C2E3
MNELTVLDYQGAKVISSREVAEMTGKEHKELMRSIRKYSGILTSANLRSLDYFIPSEYTDAKKEVRPCYLLTKIGCDMIGNKMTGTQGVLFTAAYVKQFEEMQQALNTPKVLTEKEQLKAAMKLSLETSEEMEVIKGKVVELQHMVENQITLNSGEQRRLQLAVAERVYKLEKNNKSLQSQLFRDIYRAIKTQYGVRSYRDVKQRNLQESIKLVDTFVPSKLTISKEA